MKMFMKKKYSSFLFIIMLLGLCAPITMQAQYRGLSGRAAKLALQHGIKHQKELEDLKTERDSLAVRALQGSPAGYLALQKKMNNQLALAGAAAALTAATIYALQNKIANLKKDALNYGIQNKEILTRISELNNKNQNLKKEINELKEKYNIETQELKDENTQEKEGNLQLRKLVTDLTQQHVQLINEKIQIYQENDSKLAELGQQLQINSEGMQQIVEQTEIISDQLNKEKEQIEQQ